MSDADRVIVAGAGPVGLTVALLLGQRGIPVVVLEANAGLIEDYRASTIHPPTLDLLEESGITGALLQMGLVCPTFQYRDRAEGKVAELDLSLLARDTNHPYRLQCEQFKLARYVYERLAQTGGAEVAFEHRISSFEQDDEGITVDVQTPDGPKRYAGRYLIGADGARSVVRGSLGIAFEGFTYPERFIVSGTTFDFKAEIAGLSSVNYIADPKEWCLILQIPDMWRCIFPLAQDEDEAYAVSDAGIDERLRGFHPRDEPYEIVVRAIYRVSQRVAARYRGGRAFIAGDAAHINNPLGGMGLNGGLHDALSLTRRIADTYDDRGAEVALDAYEAQRRPEAIDAVNAQTAANKKALEERDPAARKRQLDAWRALEADPAAAYAHLLRTSMIASLRRCAMLPEGIRR